MEAIPPRKSSAIQFLRIEIYFMYELLFSEIFFKSHENRDIFQCVFSIFEFIFWTEYQEVVQQLYRCACKWEVFFLYRFLLNVKSLVEFFLCRVSCCLKEKSQYYYTPFILNIICRFIRSYLTTNRLCMMKKKNLLKEFFNKRIVKKVPLTPSLSDFVSGLFFLAK